MPVLEVTVENLILGAQLELARLLAVTFRRSILELAVAIGITSQLESVRDSDHLSDHFRLTQRAKHEMRDVGA